jgi:hypothetical protein
MWVLVAEIELVPALIEPRVTANRPKNGTRRALGRIRLGLALQRHWLLEAATDAFDERPGHLSKQDTACAEFPLYS